MTILEKIDNYLNEDKQTQDGYYSYKKIMNKFDKLIDTMKKARSIDLSIAQKHDIRVYYIQHLKKEVDKLDNR